MRILFFLLTLLALSTAPDLARTQNINPRVCAASAIATGGTAVTAVAQPTGTGYFIFNPTSAADQGIVIAEVLYVDASGAAAASGTGTTVPLAPGGVFYGIPSSRNNVTANAATTGHKFACLVW